jgi:hypothetical protein
MDVQQLLNYTIVGFLGILTILFAAFSTVIETARKSARELHTHDLRMFVDGDNVTKLFDFIEASYCHNRVSMLRVFRSGLSICALGSLLLLCLGLFSVTSHLPNVKSNLAIAGVSQSQLATVDNLLLQIPILQYRIALAIEVLISVVLIFIIIRMELPNEVIRLLNPKQVP